MKLWPVSLGPLCQHNEKKDEEGEDWDDWEVWEYWEKG